MDIRIVVTLVCVLVAALSIPMMLGKVPPNSLYGFRTARTLADPTLWHRVNAFAGKALLAAATAVGVGLWFLPQGTPEWAYAGLLTVSVLVAVAASFLYLRGK